MKSGTTLRSPANAGQYDLARTIPKVANGVRVEYDIAFDCPKEVAGYKFSDLLTKAIYIAPQSNFISTGVIEQVANRVPTQEGIEIMNKLMQEMDDKYILDEDFDTEVDTIVVLPGTNLLARENVVDMEKVDRLVAEGAFVKIHPITERTWVAALKKRWGKKVIDADVPLYPIMRNANKVYFTMSSETGIAATILGKKIGTIDHPEKKTFSTFQHIYKGIDRARGNGSLWNRMAALLSYPESGILTTYHKDPEGRVRAYFEFMSQYPHKKMPPTK